MWNVDCGMWIVDAIETSPKRQRGCRPLPRCRFGLMLVACLLPLLSGCGRGAGASSSAGVDAAASVTGRNSATSLDAQLVAYQEQTKQLGGNVELKVCLANSSITDETLGTMPLPENITSLDLSATKISDAGLAHVKKIRRLKDLSLVDVPITDAGLVHLRDLPDLENVDLRHTKVSQPAQWALMKELRQRAYDRQQKK